MRAQRWVHILLAALAAGGLVVAGRMVLAPAGAKPADGASSASSTVSESRSGVDPVPAAASAAEPGEPVTPLAFPELLPREPAVRPGIGSVLAGRPVRPGERIPGSPFASWIRREQSLRSAAGVEVVLWQAGSHEPPAPGKDQPPARRLAAEEVHSPIRSWLLTTTREGRTSVLTLHDSASTFARTDYDCLDATTILSFREVRKQPSTLWIEVDEHWTCRYSGSVSEDDPPYELQRRLAFVVAVGADGELWRLASAIPLKERDADGVLGVLSATFTPANELVIGPGSTAPTEAQEAWIGVFPLAALLQQAMAVPTWADEPLPIGSVSASCGPAPGAPRLQVAADPPVSRRAWSGNPEVTVLAVPRGVERVRIRVFAVESGGNTIDVSDDPCLRLQLVGAGLRPMPVRTLYEVVGGRDRLETASIVVLYRGQRIVLRFEEAAPLAPAIPAAAAAVLTGAAPGLQLPDASRCPGWDLFADGPGVALGDLDGDGREDVAVLLLDAERWELLLATQTPRGEYRLAFHAGAPRRWTGPGGAVEELALRRTAAGDVSLRRTQGRTGEEWIVHWTGKEFQRTTLPLLRPGAALTADRLGIAPHGARLDEATAGRDAVVASLVAGDAETFAALARMGPARQAEAASWIVEALGRIRGDRTRLLAALGLTGRQGAMSAVPYLGSILFGHAEPWRADLEPRVAEWALGRMGEPALLLLALHREDPAGARAAADVIREEPQLRIPYAEALRGDLPGLAVALEGAPIGSPTELVEALQMMPADHARVLARLRALARGAPRSAETGLLLSAAVPALVGELSTRSGPAAIAAVAALLGELGPVAAPAVPALQTALTSPDCRVRVAARRALAAIRGGAPAATDDREAERDLSIECGSGLGPPIEASAAAALTRPAPLNYGPFVVRELERVDGRGYGFASPVDLDLRELARGNVPGLDVESGRGPLVEQARQRAARNAHQEQCLRFQAALPPPLRKAHYYGVTAAGVEPLDPRRLLGDVCVGDSGIAGYRGRVDAGRDGDGFVIVSNAPLTVSEVSREALDKLWPTVAAACGVEVSSAPQGIAFRLGRGAQAAQYAYAVLPAGDLCQDRRRLLRIDAGRAEVVEATDAGCDL